MILEDVKCFPKIESLLKEPTITSFAGLIEPETELLNSFVVAFPTWKLYYYRQNRQRDEQALQQVYAMYQGAILKLIIIYFYCLNHFI